jgi:hypothetical protein
MLEKLPDPQGAITTKIVLLISAVATMALFAFSLRYNNVADRIIGGCPSD